MKSVGGGVTGKGVMGAQVEESTGAKSIGAGAVGGEVSPKEHPHTSAIREATRGQNDRGMRPLVPDSSSVSHETDPYPKTVASHTASGFVTNFPSPHTEQPFVFAGTSSGGYGLKLTGVKVVYTGDSTGAAVGRRVGPGVGCLEGFGVGTTGA